MKKFTEILIISGALIFLGITIFFNSNNSVNLSGVTLVRVPQGGTGWGNIQANTVLYGNGTGKIATSTGNTNGYILALVSGSPQFISSSSITGINDWTFGMTYNTNSVTPTTTIPLWIKSSLYASSTAIIDGLLTAPYASTTGLTVTGTASTTNLIVGSSFVADTVDIQFNECSSANCGFHLQSAGVIDVHAPSQFRVSINNDASLYDFQSTQFLPSPNAINKLGAFGYAWNGAYASSTSYLDNIIAQNATTTSFSIGGLLNIGGDYLNELCGTGLTCTGNALASSLGTSVDISSETNLAATWPIILTNDTLSFGGLSTSTAAVIGNIPYFSGVNTFDNVATTSVTIGTGLSYSGTFGSVVGGTAGTLTLNATGDWTGTIDSNNFAGGQIGAGELIYGGSAGSFSELAVSTNGFVLALSSGIPAWVASTTLSTISGTLDISAQSNLTCGTNCTLTGDDISVDDAFILNTGDIGTGVYDFGGATSFEIPNAVAGTSIDAAGELTIDTTSQTFNYFDGVNENVLTATSSRRLYVENATSTDIIAMGDFDEAVTIKKVTGVLECSGACDVGYTFNLRHGLNRGASTSATTLFTTDKNITSTTTRVQFTSGFNDNTLAVGEHLWLDATAASTTSLNLNLNVYYKTNP